MAFNKKYAGLPDLDLAPDIYETPELTDASTLPTATVRSSSPFQEETSTPGIDRQRLQPDHARSQFEPVKVDARDVDFSDSVASKRKSYRTIKRSRRTRDDGTEILADISDDEEESLEGKLARLRREAEELKDELSNRKTQRSEQTDESEIQVTEDGILELTRSLDKLYASSKGEQQTSFSSEAALMRRLSTTIQFPGPESQLKEAESSVSQPARIPSTLLSNAASFDARLRLLEAALGLSQTPVPLSPDDPSESDLQPILPTLTHLSSQLSTLTSTLTGSPSNGPAAIPTTLTTPHLEALTTRIRKLTADAEALTAARRRATEAARAVLAARIAAATTDEPPEVPAAAAQATPTETEAAASEQAAKIQALYTTLPTITSLHPLLPSVLERLRSLRAIHAGAAQASEDLDTLEQSQVEMRKEIEQWREGLKAMEERVKESEAAMKSNVEVMSPWIRDLERRLDVMGK
ncbi:dynactin 2 [Coccidioides immitis RS]|uniref:Dynactin 2 n=3 Tax=Coccidioides immitis TaxID=5501 RepID=J3KHD2_COCIM|nr:dynactin 2 [Coccidioides immitis RS]EAS35262.3 dynactin 2 [Coccidioides immitis RS]KMP00503.1 hypothetical protein CIRG_00645 [Coccidioides immitis RMSCC 2394]KMU89504.1 hypothetical protein CIHG_07311 [Coccidioides immitis H538.4]